MLAASSGGCCLVFVDGAVINVALAVIGRDFELEPNALQRIINMELLPLAAMTLFSGALGDRFGQRLAFLVGIAIFGAAVFGCAISANWMQLVSARLFRVSARRLSCPTTLRSSVGAFL
jgi:MFS family permease